MAQKINEVMTSDPATVATGDDLVAAARLMRDEDAGDVLVVEDGRLVGILTDRDIAVRAVAEGRDPAATPVVEICTAAIATVRSDQPVEEAVRLMRTHAVRRLPVVDGGQAVGIVSLGDLAVARDPGSALGEISDAPPNT